MFASLVTLTSMFLLLSAEKCKINTPETPCEMSAKQIMHICKIDCQYSHATPMEVREARGQWKENTNADDMSNDQKSDVVEPMMMMTAVDNDQSPRLSLTKQQLQNLQKYALYDYYVQSLSDHQ